MCDETFHKLCDQAEELMKQGGCTGVPLNLAPPENEELDNRRK
jgi:hypothetical protein